MNGMKMPEVRELSPVCLDNATFFCVSLKAYMCISITSVPWVCVMLIVMMVCHSCFTTTHSSAPPMYTRCSLREPTKKPAGSTARKFTNLMLAAGLFRLVHVCAFAVF